MGLAMRLTLLLFGTGHASSVVVGLTKMATNQDPTTDVNAWELIKIGVAEKLYTVNKDGEIEAQIADSISGDGKDWVVTLKAGYKFSDGTELTAEDVVTCLTAMMASDAASASVGAITFATDEALKVKITSTDPTHIMDVVLAEYHFPIYKASGDSFVFTGPYKIAHFEPTGDSPHMDLEPNTHYATDAEKRPNIEIKLYSDADALAADAKTKSVDLAFHLPVAALAELRDVEGLNIRSYGVEYHCMIIYNMAAARQTTDLKVRQAIDHALDRTALSQSLQGGHGTRSYFPKGPYYSDPADKQTADTDAAGAKLDEAGYTLADGKRSKDGTDLTLTVVAYPFRPSLVTMLPEVKEQLEAVGITVNDVVTNGTWAGGFPCSDTVCFANGEWDLLMWMQNTLPAGPDPLAFLNNLGSGGIGGKAGYTPAAATATAISAVDSATTHKARVDATVAAQAAILSELPVSNLLTDEWHIALTDKMNEMGYFPYGADYYVIRADAPLIGAGVAADESADSSAMAMPAALALCAALLF